MFGGLECIVAAWQAGAAKKLLDPPGTPYVDPKDLLFETITHPKPYTYTTTRRARVQTVIFCRRLMSQTGVGFSWMLGNLPVYGLVYGS